MRILLESNHVYPAGGTEGTGLNPNPFSTGGSSLVHDWLAQGLVERGHEVFYLLPNSESTSLPEGMNYLSEPRADVDIFHHYNSQKLEESHALPLVKERNIPWLTSCHSAPQIWGGDPSQINDHWVFVSQSLAQGLGHTRFVLNGINPDQLIYSENKGTYVLFMCNLNSMLQAHNKGLDIALELAREVGFQLVVAGSCRDDETLGRVTDLCRQAGAEFRGDVRGCEKAKLLAGARALLFPTRLDESFGLVLAEASMSGTPVVTSDKGACRELVSSNLGFVCSSHEDYHHAFANLDRIEPAICRAEALKRFHYLRMTKDYEREYLCEMQKS